MVAAREPAGFAPRAREHYPPRPMPQRASEASPPSGADSGCATPVGLPRSPRPAGPLLRSQFTVLAVLSTAVGVLLLLENFGVLSGMHELWPVFPAAVGTGMVMMFFQRGRADLVLLGIGSYLAGVSALFFVLNYTTWTALSWAWPVFVGLLGASSIVVARYAARARWVALGSGSFLVLLSVVLDVVFEVSPRVWPLSLVLFGLWVMLMIWARGRLGTGRPA